LRRRVLAALLVASVGCRAYTQVASDGIGSGRLVRVRLTDTGSVQMAPRIGPRGTALEGTLVVSDDSSLTLVTRAITRANGDDERWPGERVQVRRSAVAGVDMVKTSVRRTALLTAAVLTGLALLRATIGDGGSVSGGRGGPGSGSGGQ
jgi:hypothetical protein